DGGVGQKPHDERQHHVAQGGERRAGQVKEQTAAVFFQIGPETPQKALLFDGLFHGVPPFGAKNAPRKTKRPAKAFLSDGWVLRRGHLLLGGRGGRGFGGGAASGAVGGRLLLIIGIVCAAHSAGLA